MRCSIGTAEIRKIETEIRTCSSMIDLLMAMIAHTSCRRITEKMDNCITKKMNADLEKYQSAVMRYTSTKQALTKDLEAILEIGENML
jgi:hypothetical protein